MLKLNGLKLLHYKNSQDAQTVDMPVPATVRIPMVQHMGAPCVPTVKPGDEVLVGQLIGSSDQAFSVPIHSSVSGKVKAIEDYVTSMGSIVKRVVIETDGEQRAIEGTPRTVSTQQELVDAAREAGIAGLGGAGFPTHIKLAYKDVDRVDALVINAAECEPYITSDYREMLENPDDIIGGIQTVMKCLNISKAFIGIEDNKPEAIALLNKKTAGTSIHVEALRSIYPQGAEKVLIYNTTGRIIEEGEIPADKGVIVMNVTTVANLHRFLTTGMPLTHKRVTVDGDLVQKPMNVRVPIGTMISDLLAFAGVDTQKVRKALMGGPMMGTALDTLETPVIKNNNAILVLDEKHAAPPKTTACIRCGRCIDVCPMNLMPAALEKAFDQQDTEQLETLKVGLCINCGSCTYVCPAKRNLAQKNQLAKALLKRKK
ncbi:MAG: electron transport complex subunit RsxC [Candidatus Merdivicinus sp.]|jgi:electron transport complex protein RnfC